MFYHFHYSSLSNIKFKISHMKSKLVAFCKVCMTEKVDVYAEVHGTKGRCLHSGSLLEIQLHVN